jgi:hypothetical protein
MARQGMTAGSTGHARRSDRGIARMRAQAGAPRLLMIAALGYLVLPLHVVPQRYGPLRAGGLRAIQTLLVLAVLLGLLGRRLPRDVQPEQRDALA